MERVQFNVPSLWADHHVLKVRALLSGLTGVQDVTASSAFQMVALSFDPAVTSAAAIQSALTEAGYPVTVDGQGVLTHNVPFADGKRDPAWQRLGLRVQRTDARDTKTAR